MPHPHPSCCVERPWACWAILELFLILAQCYPPGKPSLMASHKNRLPSFLLPPSTTTTLFYACFLFLTLLMLLDLLCPSPVSDPLHFSSIRAECGSSCVCYTSFCCDKMPWLKKIKEKGSFGLKIQGYKLSLWGSHGIRSLRWRVTVHLQSGSRERWMSMLSLLMFLWTPAQGALPPTFRVGCST